MLLALFLATLVGLALGFVMLLTSVAMLRLGPSREAGPQHVNEGRSPRGLIVMALAMSIGTVTGALGAGGGFLIVPALVLHSRMPMQRAVPTSLVAIALQSFAGFAGQLGSASLAWAVVVPFTLMAMLGSVVGSTLARRAPQQLLRRGFAALVGLVAVAVVARELPRVLRPPADVARLNAGSTFRRKE